MPRMQRSARGRWQVFWRSLQMQVARETQTGRSQQILHILQKGHQVCTTGMLASPYLHGSSQSELLHERAEIQPQSFLCAGVETTRHLSALARCCSSAAGKQRIYRRLTASHLTPACSDALGNSAFAVSTTRLLRILQGSAAVGGAVPAAWHLTAEVGMRRHRVVYRLVGGVYLMVVAAVQANVLWLLNLLDACVRVLIGVAKSVEVTPDKLARRYPEVR